MTKWESSDESVAQICIFSDGKTIEVEALGYGTATIKTYSADNSFSTLTVNVSAPKDSLPLPSTFFDENVQNEEGKAFVEGFQQYVGSLDSRQKHNGGNIVVSAASAMGYGAYFTVLEAMKNAKSADPEAIQDVDRQIFKI